MQFKTKDNTDKNDVSFESQSSIHKSKSNISYDSQSSINKGRSQAYDSQSSRNKLKNEEVSRNKEINIEINKIQQIIAELMNEKTKFENEFFKIPEKPKSLDSKQKKQYLEDRLKNIESEINKSKRKIRDLKNQLR